MREIKFRAWVHDPDSPTDGDMVYNFYHMKDRQVYVDCDIYDLDNSIISMQYTGLLDKNGKEIYEGDILEFDEKEWGGNDNIFVVEWDKEEACFMTGGGTNRECSEYKKVIGNKHENPELLSGDKTE